MANTNPRPLSPDNIPKSQFGGARSMPGPAASEAPRFVPRPVEIPSHHSEPGNGFNANANHPSYLHTWVDEDGPPPGGKPASNHSRDRERGSFHDTARSRLNERTRFEESRRLPDQRSPQHNDWERRRVTLYRRPQSPVSRSSHNSMRTARPRNKGRSRSRQKRRGREDEGGNSKAVSPIMAKIQEKKSGLEKIVTPLRLGLLLGCFDMIGGSLSAWMTYKRFGAAAQAAEAAKQATAMQQEQTQKSRGRSRSRRRNRHREEAPEYEEDSESDSEYDERQRRVAEHIMHQQRLDQGRSRRQ